MSIRNQQWYNANEASLYPFNDTASCVDDAGLVFPGDVICDLNLRFPNLLGDYAYLAACTVNQYVVTAIIYGCSNEQGSEAVSPYPLCTITVPQPVVRYKPYPLDAQYPNAGGWIVFGSGTDATANKIVSRFSGPGQTLFTPRAARGYRPLPVTSIAGRSSSSPLTGLVELKAGNDIEIVKVCRTLPGVTANPVGSPCVGEKEVIAIRLKNTSQSTAERNVLQIYSGPCGGRPEAATCPDPQPIQRINDVAPDCCGILTLDFRGFVRITPVLTNTIVDANGDIVRASTAGGAAVGNARLKEGVIVNSPVGISQTCTKDMPDASGIFASDTQTELSIFSVYL